MVVLLVLAPVLRDALGRMPESRSLVAGLVADQLADNIACSYSTPAHDGQALYRVTATASTEIEIDVPGIGVRAYAVTLPFHLLIDTDGRVVGEWPIDLEGAAVASY